MCEDYDHARDPTNDLVTGDEDLFANQSLAARNPDDLQNQYISLHRCISEESEAPPVIVEDGVALSIQIRRLGNGLSFYAPPQSDSEKVHQVKEQEQ